MNEALLGADPNLTLLIEAAALVLALVLAALIGVAALRRRKPRVEPPPVDLRLRVEELELIGPPAAGPQLEFYGTPVRLSVLVLAPAGRNSQLPSGDSLLEAIDCLVPGLAGVVAAQRPVVRAWPFQLSTQGFTHSFFNNVQLPGDRGRGSPWCSVAGRFETPDQQLLVGLVCHADRSNSLSQHTVEHAGQWMDILRAR
jgi:hypothetical protein